jgi:Do/DeqQ family serine protease
MRLPALALACLVVLPAIPAQAQFRAAPESRAQVQLSFAPVVKSATPSVVNVYGTRHERNQRSAAMDEFFRRFFGEAGPGAPRERVQRSLGSGVIVDPSGLVVTNHHVIENMTEVRVALTDKREFEAEIVLRDPRADLAVLKLKGAGPFVPLPIGDSDKLEVGDLVLAIGNPFGVGQTVTQGIVSALARTHVGVSDYGFFIQTDAAINPGNSGGALVDMDGRLVGINSAIYSQSGGNVGIGFAIPATMVRAIVDSAKAGSKTVRRPWLGATLQGVNQDIADGIGVERPTGALVAAVRDTGPARDAGLKRGDLILEVDGKPVDDPESFGYRFVLKGISGETPVTVLRNGKRVTLTLRLMAPPEVPARDAIKLRTRSPLAGATIVNASPAVAEELQLGASEGVVITELDDGSAAQQVGFQKGDVVMAINGDKVGTTRDLERAMRAGSQVWQITINRGGQTMTTVLGG